MGQQGYAGMRLPLTPAAAFFPFLIIIHSTNGPLADSKPSRPERLEHIRKKHSAIKGKIVLFKIQNCLVPDPQPKICPRHGD